MDEQLAILIQAYEEEVKQLEKQLEYCLIDPDADYSDAFHCQNALVYTQGKLHTLKRLNDPLYDKKISQLKWIDVYRRRLADEPSDLMKEFYEKNILNAEQELEKLSRIAKQDTGFFSRPVISTVVDRLIKKEIKNLRLILKKCDSLFLRFTYRSKTIKVILPCVKEHKKKWILSESQINSLQKLGFKSDENQLIISFSGEKQELLLKLNSLLVKIVFDIFHGNREFENDSYLQFKERLNYQH